MIGKKSQHRIALLKLKLGQLKFSLLSFQVSIIFIVNNDEGSEIGRLAGSSYDYQISDLYDLAKRKALKIDETLNDLDDILSKI